MTAGAPPFSQVPYADPPLTKPTAAFVLSLIAGIILLLWGALLLVIGISFSSVTFGIFSYSFDLLGAVELITGFLVLCFGIGLYAAPRHHVAFGVIVLIASIASLFGTGALFLGFILGLIGGILGIIHNPQPPIMMGPPQGYYPGMAYSQPSYGPPSNPPGYSPYGSPAAPPPPTRYCPGCGAPNAPGAAFCASCGRALPATP